MNVAVHSIELCAGVGMLGEGVRAAFELLGIGYRTVCYVEREAPAAAQLVTLMEAGALDPAPVWSDLTTFDGAAWRGSVDCVVAGFPCQDLSVAGKRAGLNGSRSGLFFAVLDVADACGAQFVVLENVAGIATASAAVVDEEEGELEERAASRVVGELADRGWDAEWVTLSASDVGASHGRARWFCLAWRVGDAECTRRPQAWGGSAQHARRELEQGRCVVGDTNNHGGQRCWLPAPSERHEHADFVGAGRALADTQRIGCQRWREPGDLACPCCAAEAEAREREWRGHAADDSGRAVADASKPRLPHPEQPGEPGEPGETEPHRRRAVAELCGTPLFAPGPRDPQWAGIVANRPDLAPAVESGVRLLLSLCAERGVEPMSHATLEAAA